MRDRIVGNWQILQWDLMSKSTFGGVEKKVSLYVHAVVLPRGFPILDGKIERFVTKKWKKRSAMLESDRQ